MRIRNEKPTAMSTKATYPCNRCRAPLPRQVGKGSGSSPGICEKCRNRNLRACFMYPEIISQGKACKKCRPEYRRLVRGVRIANWHALKLTLGGCIDCGYNTNGAALDFHHPKEGTNKPLIAKDKRGIQQRKLEGCELLCANCHRVRHFKLHNPPMIMDLISTSVTIINNNRKLRSA
ncbi:hypothetical protein LCGC14_1077640 [marine sediment metagenome]|uniref:HNH domain-containing protein n=1 Tax=marine sediment metagenome TaxID=412755 RepID=A0A0F9QM20_9ZZZZ